MTLPFAHSPMLIGAELLYAVLDPSLHRPGFPDTPIITNGGLTYTQPLNTIASAMGTVACATGLRNFEVHRDVLGNLGDQTVFGVCEADGTLVAYASGYTSNNYISGWVNDGNGTINYGGYFDGMYGFLFDLADGTFTLEKNGAAVFTRALGAHGPLIPFIQRACNQTEPNRAVSVETFNFGQNPWSYAPGAGWSGWAKEI